MELDAASSTREPTPPVTSGARREHHLLVALLLAPLALAVLAVEALTARGGAGRLLDGLGLLVRSLQALALGEAAAAPPREVRLLGVRIDNWTMDEAVAALVERARTGRPTRVAFVNAHCFNVASGDEAYRRALAEADLVFADGSGVRLAVGLLGHAVRQNVNGTDLFPRLLAALEGEEPSLYLLGARPGVPEAVRQWAASRYPRARVAGARDGYFAEAETPGVLAGVRASGARILVVALGVPGQDVFLHRHLEASGAAVGVGVGGLFDFFSGRIPRAPLWLRELGLEWCYRLWQEPRRMWRRYLVGNVVFLWRVLASRLRTARLPGGAS